MQSQLTNDAGGREALHREVEALRFTNWRCRAILHAMVELGTLTKLECQLPECFMDDRSFVDRKRGEAHIPKGIVIDHIHPQLQGGTDRLENLRVVHCNCNVSRARGWKMSEEAKAKIRAAAYARGGWQDAIAKRPAGWNRKLSDEVVREMRRRFRCGDRQRDIAADFGVGTATTWAAINGKRCYANVKD